MTGLSRRPRSGVVPALGLAYALFGFTFRGPKTKFWQRMTLTGLGLGTFALLAEPDLRRIRPRWKDVVLGVASAAGLYGVFQVGDRMARRFMPNGGGDIDVANNATYDVAWRNTGYAICTATLIKSPF